MNKLPPLINWPNPAFANAETFTNSVTNMMELAVVVHNLNTVIQYLQDLETDFNNYVDSSINSLRAELTKNLNDAVANLIASINSLKTYTDGEIAKAVISCNNFATNADNAVKSELMEEITALSITVSNNYKSLLNLITNNDSNYTTKFKELENSINDLNIKLIFMIENALKESKLYTDQEIEKLKLYIDEVNEDGFTIWNPVTGKRDKVGITVNDIYNALRSVHAITALEWDEWFTVFSHDGLDFKNLNLTPLQFDIASKLKMFDTEKEKMVSPFSGEEVILEKVIYQNTQRTRLAISCKEWDNAEITGVEFKNANFKPLKFDNENAKILDYLYKVQTIARNPIGKGYIKYVAQEPFYPVNNNPLYAVTNIRISDSISHTVGISMQNIIAVYGNATFDNTIMNDKLVTTKEWDNYFLQLKKNGNDFKNLSMTPIIFDTKSYNYMYAGLYNGWNKTIIYMPGQDLTKIGWVAIDGNSNTPLKVKEIILILNSINLRMEEV